MPYTVDHRYIHRIFRVGACPVLEVTVTYPCLCPDLSPGEDCPPAVRRFNLAYERIADGFAAWCSGIPLEAAEEAFRAAGIGAAYRFDRRTVTCEMMIACGENGQVETGGEICVTRTLRLGSRRGEMPPITRVETDCWRQPGLSLGQFQKKKLCHPKK